MDGESVTADIAHKRDQQPQPDPALMDAPGGDPSAPAGGLVLGEDGLPIQQEENKEDEIIPIEILQDMKNVWDVFDMNKTHSVPITHLRTIMRALDFDEDDDTLEVIQKQIDPENSGVIKYQNLKMVMEDKLKDKDTPEDMMAELRHLDRDKDDKIPVPEFKQYMQNMGSKMTDEELAAIMSEVDTRGDGYIYIDEMSQRLCPSKK